MAFLPNKVSYRIPVFDGGLNTKWSDLSAPPHMSPDLSQVEFTDVGAVSSSKGYGKLNTNRIATYPVDGLHDYYNATSDVEELIAVCGADVWVATATAAATFTRVSGSTSVYTSGVDVCVRQVEDEAWFTNGYSAPRRYNGTDIFTVGVSAFSGSYATVTHDAGAGSLTSGGLYTYYITGLNENGEESNGAQICTATTFAGGAFGGFSLTGLPVFPDSAGVSSKYLYRNTAAATGTYYRVTALTAAQTSVTDVIADANLSTAMPTDNGTEPLCKWHWYHRGRMFAAGDPLHPMRVYYSVQGHPERWPALNYLEIGQGDGYPISGIRIIGNSLAVHKCTPGGSEASLWLIYMPDATDVTDSDNWYVIKSPSAYASITDKSIAYFENMMAFLDKHGLFAFTGEQISPGPAAAQVGQYLAQSRSEAIEPDVAAWSKTRLNQSAMIAYDDKLWLAVPGSSNSLQNDELYVYDYSISTKERGQGAWSKMVGPDVNNFAVFDGDLVAGSSTDGYVYKIGDRWNADGSNLASSFYTMQIAGEEKHWESTKVWRFLWLWVDTPGNWDLNVAWRVDNNATDTGSTTVSLSGDGAEWDGAVWETGLWDSSLGRKVARVNLAGCVGKTIQFRFHHTGQDQWWTVHRLEVQYNLRSRRD